MFLVLIESIITYGIVSWDGVFNNFLKELQICQNQISIVTFNKTLKHNTETFYKDLKLLFIKNYIIKQSLYF